jgi:hypothetical protein
LLERWDTCMKNHRMMHNIKSEIHEAAWRMKLSQRIK